MELIVKNTFDIFNKAKVKTLEEENKELRVRVTELLEKDCASAIATHKDLCNLQEVHIELVTTKTSLNKALKSIEENSILYDALIKRFEDYVYDNKDIRDEYSKNLKEFKDICDVEIATLTKRMHGECSIPTVKRDLTYEDIEILRNPDSTKGDRSMVLVSTNITKSDLYAVVHTDNYLKEEV